MTSRSQRCCRLPAWPKAVWTEGLSNSLSDGQVLAVIHSPVQSIHFQTSPHSAFSCYSTEPWWQSYSGWGSPSLAVVSAAAPTSGVHTNWFWESYVATSNHALGQGFLSLEQSNVIPWPELCWMFWMLPLVSCISCVVPLSQVSKWHVMVGWGCRVSLGAGSSCCWRGCGAGGRLRCVVGGGGAGWILTDVRRNQRRPERLLHRQLCNGREWKQRTV